MANKTASKFNQTGVGPVDNSLNAVQSSLGAINAALDPFSEASKQIGQIPFYSTGARALVRIGGRPIGIAQEIKWTISYNAEPINTVDTVHAWDIDIGLSRINASLSSFIDPTKGPESDYMFHTMQSAIHQPFVEMQVLDKFGTSIFFAKGAFVSISGSVAKGQTSGWVAAFVGQAYQHYVVQSFKPYSTASKTAGLLNTALGNLSNLTGGLL